MDARFTARLAALDAQRLTHLLHGGLKGTEKESLRVTSPGYLAQTDHPVALGSTLTHPYITTDFSEAQLEFVTPPLRESRDLIQFQDEIHRYVYSHLEEEYLWASSMPCMIGGEDAIRLAIFGSSNAGHVKHVYRSGLAIRYGRTMQAISGVHYNYSVPTALWAAYQEIEQSQMVADDFISDRYFGLARNVLRYDWLITYLFGCSPALCKSFFGDRSYDLLEFDYATVYAPHATSLRLSNIGYKNQAASLLNISYDSLDEYVTSLTAAVQTPYPPYAKLGVIRNHDYQQLSANILQIENEFYGSLRPKQVTRAGERPLMALATRGVGYVELRSLDLDIFEPVGMGVQQLYFLEAFMLFALLSESPPLSDHEEAELTRNQVLTAQTGRHPALQLTRNGAPISMRTWAFEALDAIHEIAIRLDVDEEGNPYQDATATMRARVEDVENTPSAHLMRELVENGETFSQLAHRISLQHAATFRQKLLSADRREFFDAAARRSHADRAILEAKETQSFPDYLEQYLGQKPEQAL